MIEWRLLGCWSWQFTEFKTKHRRPETIRVDDADKLFDDYWTFKSKRSLVIKWAGRDRCCQPRCHHFGCQGATTSSKPFYWINWLTTKYWSPTANWCSIWWAPTLWSKRSICVSWCAARLNVKSGSRFGNPAASQRQSRGSKMYKSIKLALGWAWISRLRWLANAGSISRLKEHVVTGIRIRSYIKWPPKMGK